jgi:myosin heavy subunit
MDDIPVRLESSVYKLMLVDELGQDDGISAVSDEIDNLISLATQRDGTSASKELSDLAASATKIKTSMTSENRKEAVEELARFKTLAIEADARKFRGEDRSYNREYGLMLLMAGEIACLIALIYLFFQAREARASSGDATSTMDAILTEKSDLERSFDAERRAATELRQKIIDQGRLLKDLESQLKAAKSEASAKFPVPAPPPTAPVVVNTDERDAERKKWQQTEANLLARLDSTRKELDSAMSEVKSTGAELARARERLDSVNAQSQELEALRGRVKAAELMAKKYETDYTVLEWTNTKLKGLNEELAAEVTRLKDEMAAEFKRFRDQLADLRS